MKKRRPGRPRSPITHTVLAVRIPVPLLRRFRAAQRDSGQHVGEFLVGILERALSRIEAGKETR